MVSELNSRSSKDEVVEEFRRQSILEAALRVVARKGMEGATMAEIAHEAGIAKGTIYLYYRNREDLLDQASEFALAKLLEELEAVLAEKRPFAEQMRILVRKKFDFFQRHLEFFRVHLAIRQAEGALPCAAEERKPREVYLGRLAAFFADAIARGEIRPADPKRLALFFLEGTAGLMFRRLVEESGSAPDEDADLIVNLMLNGLESRRE
jgi:TetR/AcrR family fatty acid metabolism transcriptional regulator